MDHNRSIAIVASNSKWSLIAFSVGVLGNLLVLPYIVKLIGIRQFGICALLISVSTPLSLIGATLGQTACQALARNRARGDWQATHDACATVTAFARLCISVGAVVLACLIPIIARRLLPADSLSLESVVAVSVALVIGWTVQQASLIMQGVHVACMAYRRIAAINAIGAVLNVGVCAATVTIVPSVAGYLGALCAVQALLCGVWFISVVVSFRWCLVRPGFVKGRGNSILSFSGWLTVSQAVSSLSAQTDKYALGTWMGTISVGYFNIAQRVEEAAYSVMLKASDSLFPYFSAIGSDTPKPIAQFYFSVSWMMNLAAAAVIAPLIPWAPSIVSIWVNEAAAVNASGVLRILAVAGLLGCASHVFKQFMLGAGMTRALAFVNILVGSLAGLTAFILVPRYGLRVAGSGAAAASVLQLAVIIWLVRRQFGQYASAMRILCSTIIPPAVALAVAGFTTWYGISELHSWPRLIGAYAVTSATIVAATLIASGLSPEGRSLLADLRTLMRLVQRRFSGGREMLPSAQSLEGAPTEADTIGGW